MKKFFLVVTFLITTYVMTFGYVYPKNVSIDYWKLISSIAILTLFVFLLLRRKVKNNWIVRRPETGEEILIIYFDKYKINGMYRTTYTYKLNGYRNLYVYTMDTKQGLFELKENVYYFITKKEDLM